MNAGTNETDAEASARDCIAELRDLIAIVEDEEGSEPTTAARREELGIAPGAEGYELHAQAEDRLIEMPLAIEPTATFGVVLGTGPDRRLCFECAVLDHRAVERGREVPSSRAYELRRVHYSYGGSWRVGPSQPTGGKHVERGSAEIELTGEDREVAEAFAGWVIPELG